MEHHASGYASKDSPGSQKFGRTRAMMSGKESEVFITANGLGHILESRAQGFEAMVGLQLP